MSDPTAEEVIRDFLEPQYPEADDAPQLLQALRGAGFAVARLERVESTDLAEAVTNAERRGLPYDLLFDGMALYRIVEPK